MGKSLNGTATTILENGLRQLIEQQELAQSAYDKIRVEYDAKLAEARRAKDEVEFSVRQMRQVLGKLNSDDLTREGPKQHRRVPAGRPHGAITRETARILQARSPEPVHGKEIVAELSKKHLLVETDPDNRKVASVRNVLANMIKQGKPVEFLGHTMWVWREQPESAAS